MTPTLLTYGESHISYLPATIATSVAAPSARWLVVLNSVSTGPLHCFLYLLDELALSHCVPARNRRETVSFKRVCAAPSVYFCFHEHRQSSARLAARGGQRTLDRSAVVADLRGLGLCGILNVDLYEHQELLIML